MSVFKTAYQTTVGRNYLRVMGKTVQAIAQSMIVLGDDEYKDQDQPYLHLITGETTFHDSIPSFVHPLEVEGVDKKNYLCMDVRPFVRVDPRQVGYAIRSTSEFNLAKARLVTNKSWIINTPQSISGLSLMPCSVFSSWISEGISHRFSLDALDQLRLAIICSFYYQTLFVDKDTFEPDEIEQMNSICIKATKSPAKVVYETTAKIGKLSDVTDLCINIKTILENSRLSEFNAGFLITVLKNSWFGTNAAEMLAVSLEHPPTWVSLLYAAMSERTYRNSTISKIAERYSRDSSFIKSFVLLVEDVEGRAVDSKDF